MEVGEVIQFYDSDKRFPAWGFGGRTSDGSVSHAFNLNGAPYGDEVAYETKKKHCMRVYIITNRVEGTFVSLIISEP